MAHPQVSPYWAPAPPPPRSPGGVGAIVAAVLIGLWVAALAVLTQAIGWFVEQFLLASGYPWPSWGWPALAIFLGLVAGLPALLLAVVPRSPAVRQTGRAWALAAAIAAVGGVLRAIPLLQNDAYLIAFTACVLVLALLFWRPRPRFAAKRALPAPEAHGLQENVSGSSGSVDASRRLGALALALVAGLISLVPWLWLGALGGALEIVLGFTAAAAVGLVAAAILDARFWEPFTLARGSDTALARGVSERSEGAPQDAPGDTALARGVSERSEGAPQGAPGDTALARGASESGAGAPHRAPGVTPAHQRARLILVGGLVAGVALALIAAGMGASGAQLAALLVLPPLGFVAAALSTGWARSVAVLVGVAAFGPLALADPDELTIFLMGRDAPYWATVAAVASLALGLVLGVIYSFAAVRTAVEYRLQEPEPMRTEMRHREVLAFRPKANTVPLALAAVTLLGSGAIYLAAGQPGSFGEQLFVVMKSQASLADIPATTGPASREARIAAVYHRLVEHATTTQADLRKQLDRLHLAYRPYYLVNGLRVAGGPTVRAWLSGRDDVAKVLIDPVLRPLPAPIPVDKGSDQAPADVPWNLRMVGAPESWARGVTGEGIVVGTSDSGVDGSHPALADGYRGGDDSWFDPWADTTTPNDHNGHGTHTLASAVGRTKVGVAPRAQWVGCVNLERNLGSTSHYLDCLQFMLAPFPHGGDPFTAGRPGRAPHVLTNSWGCPETEGCDATTLGGAIDAFAAAGIAFVAAAGNTGPQCGSVTDPPSTYRSAVTVAAVDEAGRVASFSSRGVIGSDKPDVAAPGAKVLSAMPGGTYAMLSGTSMATPHVAGVIALLWSAHPELIGDLPSTTDLLRRSARPAELDSSPADCAAEAQQAGAGIVNAAEALRLAAGR